MVGTPSGHKNYVKKIKRKVAKQIFDEIEKIFDRRESYNIVWWGQWKELKKNLENLASAFEARKS